MLADRELKPTKYTVNFEAIELSNRAFTGAGFLTEFERSEELELFDAGVSLRWGKIGARLNTPRVETGYLVYVDNGYLTTVEGYTYGHEWPDKVEHFELYDLKPGTESLNPRIES